MHTVNYNFKIPCKVIHNINDFEQFKKSVAYQDIMDFIKLCAEAVVDTMNLTEVDDNIVLKDGVQNSHIIESFVEFMNKLYQLVIDIPPIKQPMRFGNKAFKEWLSNILSFYYYE